MPTYYPSYLIEPLLLLLLLLLLVWDIHFGFGFFNYLFTYIFFFLLLLFWVISFLGKLVLITSGNLHPCPLLNSTFTVCFLALSIKISLHWWTSWTSTEVAIAKSTASLVEGAETAVPFNLTFQVPYFICIKCSLFYFSIIAM